MVIITNIGLPLSHACSERSMIHELESGPIVVAFDVNIAFQHYRKGVFDEPSECY
jgi:hypothetical protein